MFIGHFAMGFGAKRYVPQVSLGILFLACQFADLLWPSFVMLGFENLRIDPEATVMTPLDFSSYPYSHSLIAFLTWSIAFAALYAVLTRSGRRTAMVVGLLVFSHWVLDVVTHRPDMPISIGETSKIGFGLWNYPMITIPLEIALFAAGVWLYNRQTKPLNRKGSLGLWVLVAFLLVIYLANIFGPPPPSTAAVAWSAQAMWLIVAWGFWIDRNRTTIGNGVRQ